MILFDIRPFKEYIEEQYIYDVQKQKPVIPLQKYMNSQKKIDVLDTEKGVFSKITCKDLCLALLEKGQFGNLFLYDNNIVVEKQLSLHKVFFKLGDSYYQILENIKGYDYIVAWKKNNVYFVQFFNSFFSDILGISTAKEKFQMWHIPEATGKLDSLFSCYLNVEELINQNACLFREMTEEEFVSGCKSGFFEVCIKIGQI